MKLGSPSFWERRYAVLAAAVLCLAAFNLTFRGVIAFLVPTRMRTKLTWYFNPFYPPFALGVGWLFVPRPRKETIFWPQMRLPTPGCCWCARTVDTISSAGVNNLRIT